MRIGIDITSAAGPASGVGNYTLNLVRHLLKIDQSNDYVLLHYSWGYRCNPSLLNERRENITIRTFKVPTRFLVKAWNNLAFPPLDLLVGRVDVFHNSDFVHAPQLHGRSVTTVHDLIALKFPDLVDPKVRAVQFKRRERLLHNPGTMIAVSECTKQDIISVLGLPENRIRVVYEAPCVDMLPHSPSVSEVCEKLGIKQPYILYLGAIEERKNLSRLAEAYAQLRSRCFAHTLVLAGAMGWKHKEVFVRVEELGLKKYVVFTGAVAQEDLSGLMQGAALFVYPSLYEGFGLPPLEAMAYGVPVITSNTSSMPEVVGSGGILIDPYNVEDLAESMYDVLSSDSLQAEMKAKGIRRAAQFTWDRVARETLAVYQELL